MSGLCCNQDSHVTTTVELQSGLKTECALDIIVCGELGQRLLGGIETVDVCLVVLGMVQSHDLLRDGWLERLHCQCALPIRV
jgi:hypothetical protein